MKYAGLLFLFAFLTNQLYAQKEDINIGKQIFMARCASCHAISKELVGPALKDVDKRRSEEWIINFIRSSQTVIKSGDTTAIRLFESHNKTVMPDHADLKKEDIQGIIAFIQDESQKTLTTSMANRVSSYHKPYLGKSSFLHQLVYLDVPGDHKPLSFKRPNDWILLVGVLGLFILSLSFAVKVNRLQDSTLKDKYNIE